MGKDIENVRHSLAHLLAAAVLKLWPGTLQTIGPAIEDGFYYDFDFTKKISEEDLPCIEKKMREILKSWKNFEKREVSESEARNTFSENEYKKELIDEILERGEKLTLYKSGNYTDLCRGGHVDNIKKIDPESFKLDRVAGAYWRGDEKNKMLTRVYGLAFETKDELQKYLARREEAKKRDHKKLGVELDLFTFSDLVGGGLPLWTPKGTLIRDLLDDFVWQLRKERSYERVDIPHITKKDLYEKSGHWEKFKDELFQIKTREGRLFAMKPMNCPHHIEIYNRKKWSYRELPQKYASTTKVYRDEQTGELAGLARVRAITQDDAHVFCRKSQLKEEIGKIWDIIESFYGAFGFNLEIRLSLHNPEEMEKYLGTPENWKEAEQELRELAKKRKAKTTEAIGEAAFYGPKLDFMAEDSLGRKWQVATIQLDMNMPERFNLSCVNEKGEEERIVMIHAATMGAIERFLAILIEHFAAAFPVWLSPVQVAVLPISDKQNKYATEIHSRLLENNIRAEINEENSTIGKKIREAQIMKIPYMLIVGKKEEKEKTVAVRDRTGKDHGQTNLNKLVKNLTKEIKDKKN